MITFTLTQEEANAIYQLVGQLPTSSNAYLLFVKLGEQLRTQAAPETDAQ
jgi:hypothetical protein